MRLFQNSGVYRSYRPQLARLTRNCQTFDEAIAVFLNDRFGAAHFLKPVLDRESSAFFANGDDEFAQRLWARKHGLPANAELDDILLAQIEEHRTEIFYNLDPMRFGDDFIRRLPGTVRRTIAWRAAPSAGGRFFGYNLVVNNFPSILESFKREGARVAPFSPAHDSELDAYAANADRPIDVLFVGTYSRHHMARSHMLLAIAALRSEMNVVMHLDKSRFTTLAETPLGWVPPLKKYRRPRDIRAIAKGPVFGRDLLSTFGQAKIVVNGAIDMAGNERGNLRVWEALGCGAAMVSDEGRYPAPMAPGSDFAVYRGVDEAVDHIRALARDDAARIAMAKRGHEMIKTGYCKDRQWRDFQELAA